MVRKLKPYLVVSFACGPMAYKPGFFFFRNLNLLLGNQWPCQGRPKQVAPFINCICPYRRENELSNKLLLEVFNINSRCADIKRLLLCSLEILVLAEVCTVCNHVKSFLCQPAQYY